MTKLVDSPMQNEQKEVPVRSSCASALVSVVVPVYNVAPFLRRCLSSIAAQTLMNIEIIVVDDGPTDDTATICSEFADRDSRFHVVTKINEGQGVARNVGLGLARGRYVAFVDGDDWIEPQAYADCAAYLDSTGADFVNFGLDFVSSNGRVETVFNRFRQTILEDDQIVECAMLDDQIIASPCNKLYRRSLLEDGCVRFPAVRACEDLYFSRAVALASAKAVFTPHVYYHALVRAGSTTRGLTAATLAAAAEVVTLEREHLVAIGRLARFEVFYRAHVLKFFAYLMLLAAFRAKDARVYKECVRIARAAAFDRYGDHADAVSKLPPRSRVLLSLSRHPAFLRIFATFARTVLRWAPY